MDEIRVLVSLHHKHGPGCGGRSVLYDLCPIFGIPREHVNKLEAQAASIAAALGGAQWGCSKTVRTIASKPPEEAIAAGDVALARLRSRVRQDMVLAETAGTRSQQRWKEPSSPGNRLASASDEVDAERIFQSHLRQVEVTDLDQLGAAEIVALTAQFALWLPIDTYTECPWLAPYAIRRVRHRTDPRAPGAKRDLWGMPDERGYFTDDNSLIKGVVKGLTVVPPNSPYGSKRLSSGLVCCHVWPATTTNPLLFSFVPNLVWLPRSLAKYSDAHLGGSPHAAHEALKATSVVRYRGTQPIVGETRARSAWAALSEPNVPPPQASPLEIDAGSRVVDLATRRITKMIAFLEALDLNAGPSPSRFSKRYHAGEGAGIDSSVWPVDQAVHTAARRALLADMRACLRTSS